MISQGSGNKTDQPILPRLWGSGFLPSEAPGGPLPHRRRPGAVSDQPARGRSASPPADARRRGASSTRWPPSRSAIPRSTPGSRSTRWRFACRRRCPTDRPLRTSPARRCDFTASTTRTRSIARPQLPAGTADGRARRRGSSSSCTAAGTSTATCRRRSRGQCQDVDQPSAALVKDLKQRGLLDDTLVIWGGEFGRTVYTPGPLTEGQLRPRPSRPLLLDVAGGRRHQARDRLRRDRRLLLQHRPRSRPHPRPSMPRSCTAWASTTPGSPSASKAAINA